MIDNNSTATTFLKILFVCNSYYNFAKIFYTTQYPIEAKLSKFFCNIFNKCKSRTIFNASNPVDNKQRISTIRLEKMFINTG